MVPEVIRDDVGSPRMVEGRKNHVEKGLVSNWLGGLGKERVLQFPKVLNPCLYLRLLLLVTTIQAFHIPKPNSFLSDFIPAGRWTPRIPAPHPVHKSLDPPLSSLPAFLPTFS